MDFEELARQCPQMSVTVRLGDLLEANDDLVRRVRAEVQAEIEVRAEEFAERLIPAAEARVMLGNPDRSTMYRWIAKHDLLTPVRIGRRNYFKAADIKRIIKMHEVKPITRK